VRHAGLVFNVVYKRSRRLNKAFAYPPRVLLVPIPDIEDLVGVGSGRHSTREMKARLDRLRKRWR